MRRALCLAVALGLLAFAAPALGQGIPVEDAGVVWLMPMGEDKDTGERAADRTAGTLAIDYSVTSEPESIPDLFEDPWGSVSGVGQALLANTRIEFLVYEDQGKATFSGGLSINMTAQGVPTKVGWLYEPRTDWKSAWYAGLAVYTWAKPPPAPTDAPEDGLSLVAASLTPTVGSGGMGALATATWTF